MRLRRTRSTDDVSSSFFSMSAMVLPIRRLLARKMENVPEAVPFRQPRKCLDAARRLHL